MLEKASTFTELSHGVSLKVRWEVEHMFSWSRYSEIYRQTFAPTICARLLMLALLSSPFTSTAADKDETFTDAPKPAEDVTDLSVDATVGGLYSTSHALVVGNDVYTEGWPSLSNAVRDAEMIAATLNEKGFEVELHTNLTSSQMSDVFKRFFIIKGSDRDARLFVWYAGHGATVDGEGYLVPGDAALPKNAAEFKLSALALRDFGTFMRQAVSKHVYAVFDSCFAGTVFASQRSAPTSSIQLAASLPVRQFLTSGDAYQEVADDGTFRELFIRAINGEERSDSNQDGFVTATELGMFISDRLTNLSESMQTPRYGKLRDKDYDRGDFVFSLPGGTTMPTDIAMISPLRQAGPSAELAFWDSVKNSKDPAIFDAYLQDFPNGSFVSLARLKKKALKRTAVPVKVTRASIQIVSIDQTFRANSKANVRSWPAANATKIARLDEGDQIWATGSVDVGGATWYRVARDGIDLGFVYAPLLLESEPGNQALTSVALVVDEPQPHTTDEMIKIPVKDRFSNLLDGLLEKK